MCVSCSAPRAGQRGHEMSDCRTCGSQDSPLDVNSQDSRESQDGLVNDAESVTSEHSDIGFQYTSEDDETQEPYAQLEQLASEEYELYTQVKSRKLEGGS